MSHINMRCPKCGDYWMVSREDCDKTDLEPDEPIWHWKCYECGAKIVLQVIDYSGHPVEIERTWIGVDSKTSVMAVEIHLKPLPRLPIREYDPKMTYVAGDPSSQARKDLFNAGITPDALNMGLIKNYLECWFYCTCCNIPTDKRRCKTCPTGGQGFTQLQNFYNENKMGEMKGDG